MRLERGITLAQQWLQEWQWPQLWQLERYRLGSGHKWRHSNPQPGRQH